MMTTNDTGSTVFGMHDCDEDEVVAHDDPFLVASRSEQTTTGPGGGIPLVRQRIIEESPLVPLSNDDNNGILDDTAEQSWCFFSFQDATDDIHDGVMAPTSSSTPPNTIAAGAAGSSSSSFPFRLHDMLNDATKKGFGDVVCWRDDDRSFSIRDKNQFEIKVLPTYFQGQTHYKSFQRQLNIYGFARVLGGSRQEMGTYTHRFLVRGEPKLCQLMIRTKIKNKGARTQRQTAPQQLSTSLPHPAGAWNHHQLAAELPAPTMMCVQRDNHHHGLGNMASSSSSTTGTRCTTTVPANNDHPHCKSAVLPMAFSDSSSSRSDQGENLVLARTKRLQVLEEKNLKILNLLEMRLSWLEMKTFQTAAANIPGIIGLSSSSKLLIDLHHHPTTGSPTRNAECLLEPDNNETGVGLWNLDGDVFNLLGLTTTTEGILVSKGNETREEEEEMETLDTVFTMGHHHVHLPPRTPTMELFLASFGNTEEVDETTLSATSQASTLDVAAELIRIFG